jgi:hypothetical protein
MAARHYRKRSSDATETEQPIAQPIPEFSGAGREMPTLKEFVALARMTQQINDAVDPILTTQTITIPTTKPIAVIFTSCWHLGSRYVNHEAFEKLLMETLAVDRLYWIDCGDQIEGMAGFFDVGSAHEQALADPKVQRAMLAEVLDLLASNNKLLAGFAGQHGADWDSRKRGEDPIKTMYLNRRIPYFDGQAYIRLVVGEQEYKLFGAHQLPGNSIYNKNHPQKRAALQKAPSADLVFMGDKHSTSVQRTTLDTFEFLAGERLSIDQYYVQVGTAKTGPDKYTIKTWSPGSWNWPVMLFRPDRHEIAEAKTLDIARILLENWN